MKVSVFNKGKSMSRTLNKVILIGNVGKDPEIKYTPSGIPVTSFRLATSDNWKDREGGHQEQTDWHTVVAWRGLAEVITRLVKKGAKIYIEGSIHSRTFEDKSGIKKYVTEILADNMLLLDNRVRRDDDSEDYSSAFSSDDAIDYNIDIDTNYKSRFDDEFDSSKPDFSF